MRPARNESERGAAGGAAAEEGGPARTGFTIVTNEIGVSIIRGLGVRGIYVINVAKVAGSLSAQPIRRAPSGVALASREAR